VSIFETAKAIEGYRAELEDRAEVIERGSELVIVVADGAGGRAGGARAADTVIQGVRQAATTFPWLDDPRAWCRLLSEMDQALVEHPEAGETTAVVAAISPTGIVGASVGDSGAWLVTPKGYDDLTENQRQKPFLGTGAAIPVPFNAPGLDGTLLVASDGLFKYADWERIGEVALETDIEQAAGHLVDLVRLRSGSLPDDVSVVLCREAAERHAWKRD
jgi:serine/threonine protein phosphatase PrpC